MIGLTCRNWFVIDESKVSHSGAYWLCKCLKCGYEREILGGYLRGKVPRCMHCEPRLFADQGDTAEQIFCTWIPITLKRKYTGIKQKTVSIGWDCICSACGREAWKKKSELNCACKCSRGVANKRWKGTLHISGSWWDNSVVRGASSRGLDLTIDINQAESLLVTSNFLCALSGKPIQKADYGNASTASLDRIDSKKGYIISNVQWVHKDVNRSKWALDQNVYIEMCHLVSDNAKK